MIGLVNFVDLAPTVLSLAELSLRSTCKGMHLPVNTNRVNPNTCLDFGIVWMSDMTSFGQPPMDVITTFVISTRILSMASTLRIIS